MYINGAYNNEWLASLIDLQNDHAIILLWKLPCILIKCNQNSIVSDLREMGVEFDNKLESELLQPKNTVTKCTVSWLRIWEHAYTKKL